MNRPQLTAIEALKAIRARIKGEWDCLELVKFGPLGDEINDIAELTEIGIEQQAKL
jgi:hypothetical protein